MVAVLQEFLFFVPHDGRHDEKKVKRFINDSMPDLLTHRFRGKFDTKIRSQTLKIGLIFNDFKKCINNLRF